MIERRHVRFLGLAAFVVATLGLASLGARHQAQQPSPPTPFTDVPFERWRELNADGVVVGTVQKTGTGIKVEVRLFQVRTPPRSQASTQIADPPPIVRQSAFAKEYVGSGANPRAYAHKI